MKHDQIEKNILSRLPAFCISIENIITYWNDYSENKLGYKSKEILGKSISILSKDIIEKINKERFNNIDDSPVYSSILFAKDNKAINMEIQLSPIKNENQVIGYIVYYFNISDEIQKGINNELKIINKYIHDTVGQLLTAQCLKIDLLKIKINNPDIMKNLENISELSKEIINNVRLLGNKIS